METKRIEPLTEEEIDKKLKRYHLMDSMLHTKNYLRESFKKDPDFSGPVGLFLRKDLEELYYKSREGKEYCPRLDFSKVPEVVNSRLTKFTVACFDKDNNIIGEGQTTFRRLILFKQLPKECYSNSILSDLSKDKLTKEEFVEKAVKLHKDKYDYSEVEYVNNRTKVKIYCNTCKEYFYQTPSSHLRGNGCKNCSNKSLSVLKSKGKDKFIEDAIEAHGTLKYNYSEVEYKNCDTKVKILCNTCGEYFYQTPDSHLRGSGCPRCSSHRHTAYTKDEFIERAREVHGDKYDYSEVDYVNNHTNIKIYCKSCGEYFYQNPSSHLKGSVCPNCSPHRSTPYTRDEFIKRAKKVHGDKFDYSKVVYVNSKTKVKILCKTCGKYFLQAPTLHLSGNKCSYCTPGRKHTAEEFIERAKEVHGDRFDYSKVVYVNSKTKVVIVDSETGESFSQTPTDHLSGKSNLNVSASGGEALVKTWLKSYILDPNGSWATQYKVSNIPNTGNIGGYVIIDFQVLYNNKTYWIEYNGKQHYLVTSITRRFSISEAEADSRLMSQIKRDNAVRKYCEENDIIFIEIPYTYNTYKKVSEVLDQIILYGKAPSDVIKIPEIDPKYIQYSQTEEEEQKNEEQ